MRGVYRDIRSSHSHRDSHIGLCQGGRIVDAIADHDHRMPFGLILLDQADLVFGQEVGLIANPKLGGQVRCHTLVVSGQHFDVLDTIAPQLCKRLWHFRAHGIGGSQQRKQGLSSCI